jgi:hypothetical protein
LVEKLDWHNLLQVYIPDRPGNQNGNPGLRFGGLVMASINGWTKAVSFSIGTCLLALGVCAVAKAQAPPLYRVDASWPKQLPNNWIMGQVGGMAVDRQDHIWVLQRPGSNTKDDLGAAQTPPASECCVSAHPVLVFDAEGQSSQVLGRSGFRL